MSEPRTAFVKRTLAETAARMIRILYGSVMEWDAGGVPLSEIPMPRSAQHARRGLLGLMHHWHEPHLEWLAALDRASGGGMEKAVRAQRVALAENGEDAKKWSDHLVCIISEAVLGWEPLSVSCSPGTIPS